MKFLSTLFGFVMMFGVLVNAQAAPGNSWGKTDQLSSVEKKIDAKQYEAAISELEKIVAKDSDNADAWNLLGFSSRKLKRYQVAEEYYARALDLEPKHKGAMEYLGELYVETDRMDKANEMLARLDAVCFLSCSEYKQLKHVIESKAAGVEARSNW